MREETALAAGHSSLAALRERVAAQRAAQGLPATVEEPTVLQHVADLMRSADPPTAKRRRRRARAS